MSKEIEPGLLYVHEGHKQIVSVEVKGGFKIAETSAFLCCFRTSAYGISLCLDVNISVVYLCLLFLHL